MEFFKSEIEKILNYLSLYMDIKNIKEKYDNCNYVLADHENQNIDICGIKQNIDLSNIEGLTVNPVYYLNDEFVTLNSTCFINTCRVKKEKMKQVMFHELMHIASTKQYVKDKKIYIIKSGIYYKYNIMYDISNKVISNRSLFLNEAMTELVAKVIYDDIFEKKYVIKEKVGDTIYKSGYIMPYTILAYLVLNYFETNKDILFEIYFNNNIKLFEKILNEKIGISLDVLNVKTNECQQPTKSVIEQFNIYIEELRKNNIILNKDVKKQLEEI